MIAHLNVKKSLMDDPIDAKNPEIIPNGDAACSSTLDATDCQLVLCLPVVSKN